MTLVLSLPQIMADRPPCGQCNVQGKSCVHPGRHCVKAPLCTTDSQWSPTRCHFCIKAAVSLVEGKATPCPMFTKKLRSLKTRSYMSDIFTKDLDLFVFSSVASFSDTHMAAHDPSHRWPKSLLAEVGVAALKSRGPYEVFKLAHSYFVRSARLPDHDSLVSEAGQVSISPLKPKRPGSRASSRVESDHLISPPPSRRDEDASAAATISGLMQTDHDHQAVVDLSDRPHTSSKYDYLFEERGGGGAAVRPCSSQPPARPLSVKLSYLCFRIPFMCPLRR